MKNPIQMIKQCVEKEEPYFAAARAGRMCVGGH